VRLHPAFQTEPTLVQFAKQGVWEEAWSFPASDCPDSTQLRRYLGMAKEVAIEVFFGSAFIGIRLNAEPSEMVRQAEAILECLRNVRNGADYISGMRDLGCMSEGATSVAYAEIGAVNAWRSVGAVRLPDPQDTLTQLDTQWPLLQQSAVGRDMLHPKALEFAFPTPTQHWIALPVSGDEAPFSLSKEMLHSALQWGTDFFG
jgi:hypothetical protein